MDGSAEASRTQVPFNGGVNTYPSKFSTPASPTTVPLLKGEYSEPMMGFSGAYRTLSSAQQEHLLKIYLKLGGVYQSNFESVLYNFLGLTLPSPTANAADNISVIKQKGELRCRTSVKSEDKLHYSNGAPSEENSCKVADGVCTSTDLLQPQVWLDLVQNCWLKQGCPSFRPPPPLNHDDLFKETECDVHNKDLCSPSSSSSPSTHTPRVRGSRCVYEDLDSTVAMKIPKEHKMNFQPSSSVQNDPSAVPIRSCFVLDGVSDVVAILFRCCGAALKETREGSSLASSAEGHPFLTLEVWRQAIRGYVEHSSGSPPEPIVMDATDAMRKLAVFPEQGATKPRQGGTNFREVTTNEDDDQNRIIMLKDFTELLRGQLCVMLRGGVACFSATPLSHWRPQSFFEQANLCASYCPFHTISRPPTLCMLLAWIDPLNMARIVGVEGTAYLRSVGLMEAALRFLIAEAQMDLDALTDAAPLSPAAKHPNPPNANLELQPTFALSGSGRQEAGAGISCLNPSRRYSSARRVGLPREGSELPTSKTVSNRSSGSHGNSQKHYLTPRPADEITASMIARVQARKLLDKLRKNTVPILRYGCYAMIGDSGELNLQHAKPKRGGKPPFAAETPDRNAMQFHQREMSNPLAGLSDHDTLPPPVDPPESVKKRAASASLRARTSKSPSSTMFQFSGLFREKISKKAYKAIFERLSRPVCDMRSDNFKTTTLPSTRLPAGEGRGRREKKDTAPESFPTPPPPPTSSKYGGNQRRGLRESSCASSLSTPRSQTCPSLPRGKASSRTKKAHKGLVRGANEDIPVPLQRNPLDTQPTDAPSAPTIVKGVRGAMISTFFAYSLNQKPSYRHSAKNGKKRRGCFASTTRISNDGDAHGRPPSGRS